MSCLYHRENEAVTVCSECGALICEACTVNVKGRNVCKICLERMLSPHSAYKASAKAHDRFYSPLLVLLFSALPGAAHMYLGLMKKGLMLLIAFFLTIYLTSSFIGGPIFGFIIVIIWFYSFFDAMNARKKLSRGIDVKDNMDELLLFVKKHPALLTVLIVIICVNIFSSVLYSILPNMPFIRGLAGPTLLIFGIYVVWNQARSKNNDHKDDAGDDFIDKRDNN